MQQRFFGTDGVRGRFGDPPLDPATVTAIGRAAAVWTRSNARRVHPKSHQPAPPTVLLAGDTRESTPQLGEWVVKGLRQIEPNINVRWGGVMPTPAAAFLARTTDADLALVLSASHNPFHDNGIKFFGPQGHKFNDASEATLEAEVVRQLSVPGKESSADQPKEEPVKLDVDPALATGYLHFLDGVFDQRLDGFSVVLDTGHGAASSFAEPTFTSAGAETQLIFAQPNGRNINDNCGSTAPQLAAQSVQAHHADLGFAFDGDADRVIVVDDQGIVRDGDEVLYLWAKTLHEQGTLGPPSIVATSMSNLGLDRALARSGITVERCDVGDRAVTEMLRAKGLRLGGEQSGHIIDSAHATTGDGLLTALAVAHIVRQADQPLSALLAPFKRFPQRLLNVAVTEKPPFDQVPAIAEHVQRITEQLGASGRLVLRYSGTEPLARVMIEAEDQSTVDKLANDLAQTIAAELGNPS